MRGRITIVRVTCVNGDDFVQIGLEDELSSVNFVSVKIDIKDFAEAVLGRGCIPIEFELQGLDRVGKRYESKTEEVQILTTPKTCTLTDREIRTALSEYEIDGWIGSDLDAKNYHNLAEINPRGNICCYRVHFCRWVDVEES